jgi:transcription elongation GreA/GreB family factor
MDKKQIVAALITELEREFDNLAKAAMEAREAATNEESKPENEYDTRALEASYLAGAQAKRANEIRDQLLFLKNLKPKNYSKSDRLGSTALIQLEVNGDETRSVFLLPSSGGQTLRIGKQEVMFISLDSPLGKELNEQKVGHTFVMNIKNIEKEYEIISAE